MDDTTTEAGSESEQCLSKKVKFHTICELFDKISQASSNAAKSSILHQYILSFEKFRTQSIINEPTKYTNKTASFFPILRLLLPQYDLERDSYGIKSTALGKLYVRVLAIDKNGDVAKKLTGEQQSSHNKKHDFGDIIFDVMKLRCCEKSDITVYDVNRHLDSISNWHKTNSRQKVDDELIAFLINGMTAIDQKWLGRIILRKMNFGLSSRQILQIYHPKANQLYDQTVKLSEVCTKIENGDQLNDGTTIIDDNKIVPMKPFRPMLCQRLDIKTFEQKLQKYDFYIETKMDGERFQLHMKDGEYKYYSRRGYQKFTDNFNETLSPFIGKLFCRGSTVVSNIILDGEMMVWHKDKKIFCTKGENIDVKALKLNNSTMRPCFCVYDVLYLNDNCLTTKPYAERMRLLQTLFNEQIGIMVMCKREKIRDSNHFIECLNDAFDDKEEGLVVKNADSQYAVGERNAGWWKIKADYIDGIISDLDLLIIGGYYKRDYINSFLMGVYKKTNSDDTSPMLYAVTKVGGGLTRGQFRDLCTKLKPHWNRCQTIKTGRTTKTINPKGMEFGECTPDVWIAPENSIILEIKASELVKSKSHGTEYTLRFPRIVSIRTDKLWNDCCTIEEFEMLSVSNCKVEKLTKRHVNLSDINSSVPIKRQKKSAVTLINRLSVTEHNNEEYQQIDTICQGLNFCILSTNEKNTPPISQLRTMILSHGGQIVANPSSSTFVCIAGVKTLRVNCLINSNIILYNIATVDWLCRALGGEKPRKKLLNFNRNDMLCYTTELEKEFYVKYDEFGDSFTKDSSIDELRVVLSNVPVNEPLNRTELFEIEAELYHPEKSPNMFRKATGLFYSTIDNDSKLDLAKIMFTSKGGRCVEISQQNDEDFYFSHLIVNPDNFNEQILSSFSQDKIKCISYKWVNDSFVNEKRQIEKAYLIFPKK